MIAWARALALAVPLGAWVGVLWQSAPSGPGGWLDLVSAGGVPGLLLLGLYGFYRGWWVAGEQFRRERERGDKLERMLFAALNVSEKVASVADKTVTGGA